MVGDTFNASPSKVLVQLPGWKLSTYEMMAFMIPGPERDQ